MRCLTGSLHLSATDIVCKQEQTCATFAAFTTHLSEIMTRLKRALKRIEAVNGVTAFDTTQDKGAPSLK